LQLRKVPEVDAPLRIVAIGDFDITACAGTHVAHSAEVALIKLTKVERNKSGQRVEFCCGQRALQDYQRKHATVSRAAAALSCAPADVEALLEQQLAAQQQLAKQLRAARDELLQHECALLLAPAAAAGGRRVVCRAWSARAPEELRELARLLVAQPAAVALLGSAGEPARVVLACAADVALDMRPLLAGLLQQLGGERGGGQQRLAQGGGFNATESALQAALDAVAAALPPAIGAAG
jgi:alanyl-tRNA synthetase